MARISGSKLSERVQVSERTSTIMQRHSSILRGILDIGYSPQRWGAYKINNILYMLITRRPSGNNKKIFLDP